MSKKAVNATHYEAIPAFPNGKKKPLETVNAVIETPKNSPHKYALKNVYGIIAFHEILPDSMEWPFDYGFIPSTLGDDGDPLDILILTGHGLFSGCLIETRVLGAVRESKDGIENDRFIGVPLPSPGAPKSTDTYHDITDLPPMTLESIKHFLREYSQRQGHRIDMHAVIGAKEAIRAIKHAIKTP